MKLRWNKGAVADLKRIARFIAKDNLASAIALTELCQAKALRLLDQPSMGRAGQADGTRELVVHPNYVVVYRIEVDAVRIIRVLHAAQQWL